MGILTRIKLRKRIKIFNNYFENNESYFSRLQIIPEKISEDITDIYTAIKKDRKHYRKQIEKYENYEKALSNHNKEVRYIEKNISDFDYESILKNPLNLKASSINRYQNIAKLLDKYKSVDKKYLELKKQIANIEKNVDGLKKQYKLLPEYKTISKLPTNCYIDRSKREQLYAKAGLFKNKLKETGEILFYDFSFAEDTGRVIDEANDKYIKDHIHDKILSDVNNRSLDEEQRKAVVQDEDASLTIAGAGSGKTLTICGKVKYLIERQGVKPDDILLLSYSKNSADDLEKKVKCINNDLKVGTFHKIGLEILKDVKNKTFIIEEQYNAIIEEFFRVEMMKRPISQQKILKYYSLFLSNNHYSKKYKDKGELYQDLRKADYKTLHDQLMEMTNNYGEHETIKHERVKSFEEMVIANFYFINGVNYEYERPYEHKTATNIKRQYTPDFYLPDYKLYHEHYGVDEKGEANQFEKDEADEYVKTMKWKQNLHKEKNTICLETYSYEFSKGIIFDKLTKELKAHGVKFKPLSAEQISDTLNSIYQNYHFKSFINLVKTFINLYKAKYSNDKGFDALKKYLYPNKFESMRGDLFLDICKDIYSYYMDKLRSNDKIDFDDMILQSMQCLDKTNKFKYKYIIVDEFQDISLSRMRFLSRLINHGHAKLFAVGDDWQAIYRFAGCDLNVFLNFDVYFGEARKNYITSTHRNSQELQDIAGPFICKNKQQFNKVIKSDLHLPKPIQIAYYEESKPQILDGILKNIYRKNKNAHVLLLGRNNFDLDDILTDDLYRKNVNDSVIYSKKYPLMNLEFCTVHSSKGLERDYVILISADDARNGFPNKVEDDPLLDLVLSKKSEFEYAEERRLWYVALTRTKSYTFIIANRNNPSIFVNEILKQCFVMNPKIEDKISEPILCPVCKSGHLVLREDKNGGAFYGCSNYPYCNYTNKNIEAVNANVRCPKCHDFLVIRKNKNGKFYGCCNYPDCNYTKSISKKQNFNTKYIN